MARYTVTIWRSLNFKTSKPHINFVYCVLTPNKYLLHYSVIIIILYICNLSYKQECVPTLKVLAGVNTVYVQTLIVVVPPMNYFTM